MQAKRGATVALSSVSQVYEHGVTAVSNISLKVEAGEFLTFLGPSGSGKSTTLLIVAGFLHPTQGDVWIDDRIVTTVPTYKRNLGFVFQDYALFPHMSVFENIAFPLRVRRSSREEIETRVRNVLGLVQLAGLELRKPSQLSGGQQQRVALARALVFDPPVLLMDEPLGALDRQLRKDMQIEIRALQQKLGLTVIYVTHDQEEALLMSDRIAVLYRGRIEQIGTPQDLYEEPVSRFVAEFIGEMNCLEATIEEVGNQRWRGRTHSGVRLEGALLRPVTVGTSLVVGLRPEKIHVDEPKSSDRTEVKGYVEEVAYVGEWRKYRVRVEDERLWAKVPNVETRNNVTRGQLVALSWRPADAKILEVKG